MKKMQSSSKVFFPVFNLVLCVFFISTMAGAEPDFQKPEDVPLGIELLTNGGLEIVCSNEPPAEAKAFYSWPPCYNFYPRRNGGNIVIDPEVSMEGHRSLRLDPQLLGDSGFKFSHKTAIPAREGDVFHAVVYMQVEGGFESWCSFSIDFRVAAGGGEKTETVATNPPRVLPGKEKWRKIELTAAAPPRTRQVSGVGLKVSNTTMIGRCWWDAMSLTKLKAGEPVAVDATNFPVTAASNTIEQTIFDNLIGKNVQ